MKTHYRPTLYKDRIPRVLIRFLWSCALNLFYELKRTNFLQKLDNDWYITVLGHWKKLPVLFNARKISQKINFTAPQSSCSYFNYLQELNQWNKTYSFLTKDILTGTNKNKSLSPWSYQHWQHWHWQTTSDPLGCQTVTRFVWSVDWSVSSTHPDDLWSCRTCGTRTVDNWAQWRGGWGTQVSPCRQS